MLLPVLGVIAYVIAGPRSTEDERNALASYQAAVVPHGEFVAKRIGDLARLHAEGVITDEEFEEHRKVLIWPDVGSHHFDAVWHFLVLSLLPQGY